MNNYKLSKNEQSILDVFSLSTSLSASDLHKHLSDSGLRISLVTVSRRLSELAKAGFVITTGGGRSTKYQLSTTARLYRAVDPMVYVHADPDTRNGLTGFSFEIFNDFPANVFTDADIARLDAATTLFKQRTSSSTEGLIKKEMERLVIELSWKSSKIEGNTYTLLDTEKLILENKEAPGHSRDEARMILNHKDAFEYTQRHLKQFQTLTRKNLEELHTILTDDLNIPKGFRAGPVGITGSTYHPLDNKHQIEDDVDSLARAVSRSAPHYSAAFLALIGIGYIQPFEDGNKRTSRLMANALLMSHGLAPLSYRSVDDEEYRASMLSFYELNTLLPMKKIFIEQYEFAARNYAVSAVA